MADRPDSFDPTTPAGTASPRDGDNEIRQVKEYTQNGWNDMTATDRMAVGRQTHPLYGTNIAASSNLTVTGTSTLSGAVTAAAGITGPTTGAHNGSVGATTPNTGNFTTLQKRAVVNSVNVDNTVPSYTLLQGTATTVPTVTQFNGADLVFVYI